MTTDAVPAGDVAQISGPVPADQVCEQAGLKDWQWAQAHRFELVPTPVDRTLSTDQAADVLARAGEIRAAVGEDHPIGAVRAAERLAARTDIARNISAGDIENLVEAGLLAVVNEYKGHSLYSTGQLDHLDAARILELVEEREAWIADAYDIYSAAARLGWKWQEVDDVVRARGIPLRYGRMLSGADVEALAADEMLNEQLTADRLIPADAAAEHLEVRRSDFDHLVRLDLVQPTLVHHKPVGRGNRSVKVPLYRTGDLDDVAEHAPVDFEEIRATKPGKPSPLAWLGAPSPSRADAVRKGLRDLAKRYGVDVFSSYNIYTDQWEVDYDRHSAGAPPVAEFRDQLAAHPAVRRHAAGVVVGSEVTAAVRWARRMREPGTAVVLDTETTSLSGYVVQIAILDAATGEVLLDSLVHPGDVPMDPDAQAVHGISLDDLTDAPALADLWPRVLDATRGRTVIAYNASFDEGIVLGHAERDGLGLAHLGQTKRWQCLMNRRSDWLRTWRFLPLGGNHDAVGDCQAAIELLTTMTSPAH